jgi:hypothetical protein
MARHKKTKKHSRRRRHRGGFWSINPMNWGKPAPLPEQTLELPPAKIAQAAAPMVPSPSDQAAAVGTPPGSADILGPTASTGTALGGRRRRTRKHRKSRRSRR